MATRRDLLRGVGPGRPVLVHVFLRGGADGLGLVAPYSEPAWTELRPSIGYLPPDSGSGLIDLDGRFGLHPALGAWLPAWQAGELAIVHAVGSDDATRSHFEAQDRAERAGLGARERQVGDTPSAALAARWAREAALPGAGVDPGSGWLARHLRSRTEPLAAMSAVAFGQRPPESLRGAPVATVGSLDDTGIPGAVPGFEEALAALYGGGTQLDRSAQSALETLSRLRTLDRGSGEAGYPTGELGVALASVARLVRADVGLEVATIDHGNWDTHFGQEALLSGLGAELAGALAAFRRDLGPLAERVVVLVTTEFGRRAYENVSLGTDHGRGSVALAWGGGVRGGRVLGDWPGLQPGGAETISDLGVTTDLRDLYAEALLWLGNPAVDAVLPGWEPEPVGLLR